MLKGTPMRPRCSLRALFALAVLALAAARPAAAREVPRLGDAAAPTAQAISLTLDPAKSDYRGAIRVDLDVRRATSEVRFHARGQELLEIALTDAAGKVHPTTLGRQDDMAVLTAPEPLAPGRYRLALSFTQKYNERAVALYKADFQGTPYLFTQLEATEAREAFPCWDEPAFKIPWTLTLTVPAGQTAISNMPVASESENDGSRTVTFAASPPMPSYLVAIAVGPFELVPVPGTSMPTRIVTAKGQSALAAVAARETPAIVAALESYFGRPYPYSKLDLIAVPEFAYGAMENAGAITFADRILLADAARVDPAQLRALVNVTAHELAHMWFGDLVTMRVVGRLLAQRVVRRLDGRQDHRPGPSRARHCPRRSRRPQPGARGRRQALGVAHPPAGRGNAGPGDAERRSRSTPRAAPCSRWSSTGSARRRSGAACSTT